MYPNPVWEESCVRGILWEESRVGGILYGSNPLGAILCGRNPVREESLVGVIPWEESHGEEYHDHLYVHRFGLDFTLYLKKKQDKMKKKVPPSVIWL